MGRYCLVLTLAALVLPACKKSEIPPATPTAAAPAAKPAAQAPVAEGGSLPAVGGAGAPSTQDSAPAASAPVAPQAAEQPASQPGEKPVADAAASGGAPGAGPKAEAEAAPQAPGPAPVEPGPAAAGDPKALPDTLPQAGEALWRAACDHLVKIAVDSGVLAQPDAAAMEALRLKCLEDFATSGEEIGDAAARCMLTQVEMDDMDPCVLPLRRARAEAAPKLASGDDPWSAIVALRAELYDLVRAGLAHPKEVQASVDSWMKKHSKDLTALCLQAVRLPIEDPDKDYSQYIAKFEQGVSPATFEALAAEILAKNIEPAKAKALIASVMAFDAVCRDAQTMSGEP